MADAISFTEGGGDSIENLVGHGNTIAFTHYQGKARKRTAWLLVPTHGKKCPGNGDTYRPAKLCRRLSAAAGGVTTAVDTGRVLTVAPDGTVRLLSTSGHLRRTWNARPGIVNARLRGRTLAVQQGSSLDIFDAVTGAKRQTIPLATNEGACALPARHPGRHGGHMRPAARSIWCGSRTEGPGACHSTGGAAPRCSTRAKRPVRDLESDVQPPSRAGGLRPDADRHTRTRARRLARRRGSDCRLGTIIRLREELSNRTRPSIGRDRRSRSW